MKGIKMNKAGAENTETLEMLTRKIDGEMCLDVECGPNRAILYLSKLIGGSKNECILHGMDWLTPNAFQKMSGRGSAKDWKRSIRHNGVSLKTFMLCGVLEMPADSKLRLKKGKEADSKLQNLTGNKRKPSKTKVDVKKDFERSVDDDISEVRQDGDDSKHVTDIGGGLDKEQEINRQIESGSDDNEQNENPESDIVKEEEIERKTPKESTGRLSVSTLESTKQTNKNLEILVSEKLSVDPYEMTVTPPPTPPLQVYGDTLNGQIVQSKLHDTSDEASTLPIKYKPYLLLPDVKHDEMNTKGVKHTISKENLYSVTSPTTDTTKQRNSTSNTREIHRHSVIVTYPNSSTINPRIPTDRHVFTHSTIQPYDHFQPSYITPESDSRRLGGDDSRVPKFGTREFQQIRHYSSIKDRDFMNAINHHSGFKRQYDELEQEEPLDLSIKKKKIRDQDSPNDKSRDDHVSFTSKSDYKTSALPMDIISHLSQIPIPKFTHNHLHPLLHQTYPLQRLKYDHSMDEINPYLYGFYVNPLQN